ncbi:WD40 repeat domain-containing protein [Nonomuraea soli]|uniref:WD40 repeat protein n=1 Tax=Nonomuraea soli TaxID=1032476 RepID=A0A7W0HPF5_9ACTN|nr:WD40 repeat domain-containing protein [Nonomuraea soli]MBA2890707.1 WD40 repeat protein [Nonomuraea soli]
MNHEDIKKLIEGSVPVDCHAVDLVGSGAPFTTFVKTCVGSGDVELLTRIEKGGTLLEDLLGQLPHVFYPRFLEGETPVPSAIIAARRFAGLALSISDPSAREQRMEAWQDWQQRAYATPIPGRAGTDAALAWLSNEDPGTAAEAAIRVLFAINNNGQDNSGLQGRLSARLIPDRPPGLAPDPSQMTFFSADKAFRRGLEIAWRHAGGKLRGQVLWTIESQTSELVAGPMPRIVGGSLSTAFAFVLNELERRHRRLHTLTWFNPRSHVAIIGDLKEDGTLASVGGYEQKVTAAAGIRRLVVPEQDFAAVKTLTPPRLKVRKARTWQHAARQARRPHTWKTLTASLVLLASSGGAYVLHDNVVAAGAAALLRQSDDAWQRDPVLAGHLAARSWALTQTPAARYRMLRTITTRLRAVLPVDDSKIVIAFSPDNTRLATAGERSGVLELWDSHTGDNAVTTRFPGAKVRGLSFSADGARLAVALSDKSAVLLDPTTLRPLTEPLRHDSPVLSVSFSRDGRSLATVTEEGTVRLWDVERRRLSMPPLRTKPTGQTTIVALSPRGDTLATGGNDGKVQLWDLGTRRLIKTLTEGNSIVNAVTFAPDGATLAAGGTDYAITVWDVGTRKTLATFRHDRSVTGLAFSADGKTLASSSTDMTARLWDMETLRQRGAAFDGQGRYLTAVALAPDGRTLATAVAGGTVRLWDTASWQPEGKLLPTRHNQPAVTYHPDGRLAVADGNEVHVWDLPAGTHTSYVHPEQVRAVAVSPDGRTLATTGRKDNLRLWSDGAVKAVSPATSAIYRDLAYSQDGKIIATGGSGQAQIWDAASAQPLTKPFGKGILGLAVGGETLALAHSGTVELRTTREPERPGAILKTGWSRVSDVDVSDDGELVAAAEGQTGRVGIWDAGTHRRLRDFVVTTSPIYHLAFSSDARMLAAGTSNGEVHVWNVEYGGLLAPPLRVPGGVTGLAFSPTGEQLAVATDSGVEIWRLNIPDDPLRAICALTRETDSTSCPA